MGKLLLSILFVLIIIVPVTAARGWRGIIPLHSTRADVERLLGKPLPDRDYLYQTENDFVRVDYAKGPCDGWLRGWNVPRDTVLEFTVRSNTEVLFSDLRIDTANFWKAHDDAFFTYYANRNEGIQYTVSSEGFLSSTNYFPASKDSSLRCKCFPPEDGSVFRGVSWDSFEGISIENILARLDNFAIQLTNSPTEWKGHVIIYSPLRAGRRRATAYHKRIRNWLIVKRQIDSRRVAVIDGGHRENFAGELYLLPPGVAAPPPLPTVASCEPKRGRLEDAPNKALQRRAISMSLMRDLNLAAVRARR